MNRNLSIMLALAVALVASLLTAEDGPLARFNRADADMRAPVLATGPEQIPDQGNRGPDQIIALDQSLAAIRDAEIDDMHAGPATAIDQYPANTAPPPK